MVWQIARHSLLENLRSLTFSISLLLFLTIFGISGFVFVGEYQQLAEDYSDNVNQSLEEVRRSCALLAQLASERQALFQSPSPLQFFAEGASGDLPNLIKVSAYELEYPENRSRRNFMLPGFNAVDWSFIVGTMLSFVAILFTYDAISGEKERSTLRLVLANAIPRAAVLLGKFIGASISASLPLMVGMLLSLTVIVTSSSIAFAANDWVKLAFGIALVLIYLFCFTALGLLVSSRTSRSAVSLMILLLVWTFSIIVIPALSEVLAGELFKLPTRREVEQQTADAVQAIWDSYPESLKIGYSMSGWSRENPKSAEGRDDAERRSYQTRFRILDRHLQQMLRQVKLKRNIARLSPTSTFMYASEAIAGTGIARFEQFYKGAKTFKAHLLEFIRTEDLKDPESTHFIFNREHETISRKPVSFRHVPRFEEEARRDMTFLKDAVWDIAVLVVLTIGFFLLAYVSFIRSSA